VEKLKRKKAKYEEKVARAKEKGKSDECATRQRIGPARQRTVQRRPADHVRRSRSAGLDVRGHRYVAYKQSKVDFISVLVKVAQLVSNLKSAGLM
jgi:hypothetical protein